MVKWWRWDKAQALSFAKLSVCKPPRDAVFFECYLVDMNANLSKRRLDHLVLPTRDLEAQAAFYGRLGFKVGARNIHPWGTENRLVQFDGCFLELITMGDTAIPPAFAPRQFSFGAHVGDWLHTHGDGMSMLACDSKDAAADAVWFNQAGIVDYAPFHFGRKGKRPDGSDMEVAFTLAYTTPVSMPDLCFFMCQQHNPENFWNSANQRHENTAKGVARVVVVHNQPAETVGFLKSYLGGSPAFDENNGVLLSTAKGVLSVLTPEGARAVFGDDPALFDGRKARFAAVVFEVNNLAVTELTLRTNNVPHRREAHQIVVPSGAAFGVLLAFEEKAKP
jgi:catechol 2,3-dioxygenase-like lactoylglutathione lyase family enzyme